MNKLASASVIVATALLSTASAQVPQPASEITSSNLSMNISLLPVVLVVMLLCTATAVVWEMKAEQSG